MRFEILSHAGLGVTQGGTTLLCDPWLAGSTYWRSWWNYPPVQPGLFSRLAPDAIYLTHIHWDHFQGVSLRRFSRDTRIIIPRAPGPRMLEDLQNMGFTEIVELGHGESFQLSDEFKITSYHFHIFLDSALVIETEGHTLLNANDCKIMGAPLHQLLKRHPKIDFVFRSHSSANSRLCYEIMDDPTAPVDDQQSYVRDFTLFARAVGAEYAIPFASNHCYLHREVFHFNDKATTPLMVKKYFEDHGVDAPQISLMVAGDSWSADEGFELQDHDFFSNRQAHLEDYAERMNDKLEQTYEREARATMTLKPLERYFSGVFRAMPWFVRRMYRSNPVLYVLSAGERNFLFQVDFYQRTVRELESFEDRDHPIQIHTAAAIMRHCMAKDLFTHLAISKRVRYRVTSEKKTLLAMLNLFFNFYEYEMLPLRRLVSPRSIRAWLPRWREFLVYARVAANLALGRGFDMSRHLPASGIRSIDVR
jgi:UDP-MurNAc hydroxylase